MKVPKSDLNQGKIRASGRRLEPGTVCERLAEILATLPPLYATASYSSQDPKYKRVSIPKDYLKNLAPNSDALWIVRYHPNKCLRATLLNLGDRLLNEIREEIVERGPQDQLSKVECLQQQVSADAKGRWRLSHALTDSVEIEKRVVLACRSYWIEIWGIERWREQRLPSATVRDRPAGRAVVLVARSRNQHEKHIVRVPITNRTRAPGTGGLAAHPQASRSDSAADLASHDPAQSRSWHQSGLPGSADQLL